MLTILGKQTLILSRSEHAPAGKIFFILQARIVKHGLKALTQ